MEVQCQWLDGLPLRGNFLRTYSSTMKGVINVVIATINYFTTFIGLLPQTLVQEVDNVARLSMRGCLLFVLDEFLS